MIGRSQNPSGLPVGVFLLPAPSRTYERRGISALVIVTSNGSNVDVKQSRRIASIREISGRRGFRLADEVGCLKCVRGQSNSFADLDRRAQQRADESGRRRTCDEYCASVGAA